MSNKKFNNFLEECKDILHFHSIDSEFKVSYRSENVEICGTLNQRSVLNKTASAWELFDELDENSIVATITIKSADN